MPKVRKNGGKQAVRQAVRLLQMIERSNESLLGADETAARCRRYVAAHETPNDDRAAFEKLCTVIFAQGIGFETVEKHRDALAAAFCDYATDAVAHINDARVGALLEAPIIRNRSKVEACLENARRWQRLAAGGAFMGRIASIAARDDAGAGWPLLVAQVQADFTRLREATARMLLKRWGFFTVAAHPGAQRVLSRLGLIESDSDGPSVQRFVAGIAEVTGRDPYAVEASLAMFGGLGPCRLEPKCSDCILSETCPFASAALAASEAALTR